MDAPRERSPQQLERRLLTLPQAAPSLDLLAKSEGLLALPGVRLAPMPPAVLIASALLPGTPPRDPADRIIAATSRAYGFTIVTRDGALIPYGQARHIDVVAC